MDCPNPGGAGMRAREMTERTQDLSTLIARDGAGRRVWRWITAAVVLALLAAGGGWWLSLIHISEPTRPY